MRLKILYKLKLISKRSYCWGHKIWVKDALATKKSAFRSNGQQDIFWQALEIYSPNLTRALRESYLTPEDGLE